MEAAGVATREELNGALAQLPDEVSRGFLEDRIFTYEAGDEKSHQQALSLLRIAYPTFEGVRPITTMDAETIQGFLAELKAAGVAVESFSQEFIERVRSFLTSRSAA